MSRRIQIIVGIKALVLLAILIHWRFFVAQLEAAGVPTTLISVAAIAHIGLAVVIVIWATHGRRLPGADR